jgi:hypothetical protein
VLLLFLIGNCADRGRDNPKFLHGKTQPEMCRFSASGREAALYVQASRPKSAAPFLQKYGYQLPATSPARASVWLAIPFSDL